MPTRIVQFKRVLSARLQMIQAQGLSIGELCRGMKLGETAVRRR